MRSVSNRALLGTFLRPAVRNYDFEIPLLQIKIQLPLQIHKQEESKPLFFIKLNHFSPLAIKCHSPLFLPPCFEVFSSEARSCLPSPHHTLHKSFAARSYKHPECLKVDTHLGTSRRDLSQGIASGTKG